MSLHFSIFGFYPTEVLIKYSGNGFRLLIHSCNPYHADTLAASVVLRVPGVSFIASVILRSQRSCNRPFLQSYSQHLVLRSLGLRLDD